MSYNKIKCKKCNGTGLINSTKDEVIVKNIFGKELNETSKALRSWKKNGHKVECDACHGVGEILGRREI